MSKIYSFHRRARKGHEIERYKLLCKKKKSNREKYSTGKQSLFCNNFKWSII